MSAPGVAAPPWEKYAAAPAAAGPWAKYASTAAKPDATKPTSETLGAEEGGMHVFDRLAKGAKRLADSGIIPFLAPGAGTALDTLGQKLGLPSEEQAEESHKQAFAKREQTQRPGEIGRFGAEVAATAPLAALGPVVGGGLTGAAVGEGETPGELAEDVVAGAAGGKIAHELTGVVGRAASPYTRKATEKASEYVTRLLKGAGKTAADVEKYGEDVFNKPVTGAEAIGRPGKTALLALGRREGATPDELEGFLTSRRLAAPDRMLGDFSETVGVNPEAAQGNIEALVKQGREEAAPLYEHALNALPVTNERLEQFARDGIVRKGMQRGIRIVQLESLAKGVPFEPSAYSVTGFDVEGNPEIGPVPTWRTWDAAKKGLDDVLEQYRDKTTGRLRLDEMGRAINSVRASMLNELDYANPAYKGGTGAGRRLSLSERRIRKGPEIASEQHIFRKPVRNDACEDVEH